MTPFRWGILAPGRIAHSFARDLAKLPDATLVAAGSRDLGRAEAFAAEFAVPRAYGSYHELIADPEVEAIYVASPHPFHEEHTIACLRGGKPVLCEKPLAVNARQATRMIETARTEGIFLMEAHWTRFLPVIRQVSQWLEKGLIGEPRLLSADFGFRSGWTPEGRLLNRDLAGGALLDVGTYTVSLAHMVFGRKPDTLQALGHLGETGVDEQTAITLRYDGGALARLFCAVRTSTPHEARIEGTEGSIAIPAFWHATKATLSRAGQEPVEATGEVGYHFEAQAVAEAVRAGRLESAIRPWAESLAIAEVLDAARAQIGLVYPWD